MGYSKGLLFFILTTTSCSYFEDNHIYLVCDGGYLSFVDSSHRENVKIGVDVKNNQYISFNGDSSITSSAYNLKICDERNNELFFYDECPEDKKQVNVSGYYNKITNVLNIKNMSNGYKEGYFSCKKATPITTP